MYKLSIYLLIIISGFSCSSDSKEKKNKIDQLSLEIKNLKELKEKEDSTENYFVDYANEIHENLGSISLQQNEILIHIKENPKSIKNGDSLLTEKILLLDKMVEENNKDIEIFKTKFDSSNIEAASFSKLMGHITIDIDSRNEKITELQSQLNTVDGAFEDLFSVFGETLAELDETKKSLTETTKYLNTVWYISGTKKELEEKGIITSTGGFIGIGKNNELKTEFNIAHFKKGNKKTLRNIEIIKGKEITDIITSHPKKSFSQKNGKIKILNPNDFWSISKYLVILIR